MRPAPPGTPNRRRSPCAYLRVREAHCRKRRPLVQRASADCGDSPAMHRSLNTALGAWRRSAGGNAPDRRPGPAQFLQSRRRLASRRGQRNPAWLGARDCPHQPHPAWHRRGHHRNALGAEQRLLHRHHQRPRTRPARTHPALHGFGPKSLALAGKHGDGAVLALPANPGRDGQPVASHRGRRAAGRTARSTAATTTRRR